MDRSIANTKPMESTSSKTLLRGLDVIEALSDGPLSLADLAQRLSLTRSTTHRLATTLVERGYLAPGVRSGYRLGPKLLELGFRAQGQLDLVRVSRRHLEALAEATDDTVHLGELDGPAVRYLDKIDGRRRVRISSRIGDLQPLTSTGLGKALLVDGEPAEWVAHFMRERVAAPQDIAENWLLTMQRYADAKYAFDLEENEDQIRCVAAPIRNATGHIVGAISVSSAAQYMSDARMDELAATVRDTASQISRELGWAR